MALQQHLLDILVCPACRGALETVDAEAGLKCPACALVYPVRDDIPIMLEEEAVPVLAWDRGERAVKRPRPADDAGDDDL